MSQKHESNTKAPLTASVVVRDEARHMGSAMLAGKDLMWSCDLSAMLGVWGIQTLDLVDTPDVLIAHTPLDAEATTAIGAAMCMNIRIVLIGNWDTARMVFTKPHLFECVDTNDCAVEKVVAIVQRLRKFEP